MMLALTALSLAYAKKRNGPAVIGGMLLGILVGVYVWSWTFGWLWLGILLAWTFAELAMQAVAGRRSQERSQVTCHRSNDLQPETCDWPCDVRPVTLFLC